MGKYTVTTGQNIYDVALHLYGSIEGVVDLLIHNEALSFGTRLHAGDILSYTDDYVISSDTVAYYKLHNITPANGERNVYLKTSSYPVLMEMQVDPKNTQAELRIAGSGMLDLDWGDNSPIERIVLVDKPTTYSHCFDNLISGKRKIRVYSETPQIKQLDVTSVYCLSLCLFRPLYIETFTLTSGRINLDFISLFTGTYEINLQKTKTVSLLPLLYCKELMKLDLSGSIFEQDVIDSYLIALVKNYQGRRNAQVILSGMPSGNYEEPTHDEHGNYIIQSGMQAIWVITHEPTWNEAGEWQFSIGDTTYTGLI